MEDELKRFVKDPPTIETRRLIFRPIRSSDAADMFDYARREEVTKYLLWSPHPDLAFTKKYIARLLELYKQGQYFDWAAVEKESSRMIGTAGFALFDTKNNVCEIGYVLSSDYWRRGYGTEIARELLSFAFNALGFHRVQARYMIGNTYSRVIMDHIGMTFEGVLRQSLLVKGTYRDIGVCSMLRDEFFAKYESKNYEQKSIFRFF